MFVDRQHHAGLLLVSSIGVNQEDLSLFHPLMTNAPRPRMIKRTNMATTYCTCLSIILYVFWKLTRVKDFKSFGSSIPINVRGGAPKEPFNVFQESHVVRRGDLLLASPCCPPPMMQSKFSLLRRRRETHHGLQTHFRTSAAQPGPTKTAKQLFAQSPG